MAHNGSTAHATHGVVSFASLDASIQKLLRAAVEAREFAYAPYSRFKVGACVELASSGALVAGCNVENASFTVGTCAERCAMLKAISDGHVRFRRIAVVAHQERSFTSPCGACRQFMCEFGDFDVYLAKPDLKDVQVTSVNALLPFGFVPNKDYTF